jgi:carbon-monoxide dehydrogenase small subunit
MEIRQRISVSRPVDEVWAFLADVPTVAACIPGAELGEGGEDDRFTGRFNVKVGPLTAKMEGEGRLTRDDATKTGTLEGKGLDKRGGSRVTATLRYAVVAEGEGSAVDVEADVTLAGPLAQIGRTGIIDDVARSITRDFAAALEERLSAAEPSSVPTAAAEFDAGGVVSRGIWARFVAWLKALFGRG